MISHENVTASGTVTTTIIDNTGTPEGSNPPPPEANSEDTIIKLVALNTDGTPKFESDGKTYTFINDVTEDDAAGYKAVAFNKQTSDVDGYTTDTQLSNQLGSVKISTFATDSDGNTPDATDGTDYVSTIVDASGNAITDETVALNTVFYVDTTDDNIADNNEVYTISIDNNGYVEPTSGDKYENVTASGTVTTTIIDNTGTPEGSNPPPPEANSEDTIIKLVALNTDGTPKFESDGKTYTFINDVTEDDAAGYKAVAFNKQTSDVDGYTTDTQLSNQLGSVKISTFATDSDGNTPDATDGTDYVSTIVDASGNAITDETVALNTVFYVDTTDDNIADNNEVYTISIDNNGYVEPTSGDKYENVTASGTVTTTIIDNTGTPEGSNPPPPEANSEDTIIKLVALNTDGTPKFESDGKTYTFINDVTEDDAAGYKAVAFNKQTSDVDGYTTDTQLSNQLGSVKISTFATDSDGNTPDATDGTDYVSTIVDASGNAITDETVALNTVFYVDTTDDNIADNNEVYTISIDNNGYVEPTSGDKYENVTASGTVTTTIIDNTGTPEGSNPPPPEANSEDTIIKLVALNTDGTPKFESDGKTYTFINDVTEDDAAGYKAVAFNKQTSDVDGYTTDTQLSNQLGSVKISTFATDSDGNTPDATDGTDYVSTIVDASGNAITDETVALNTVFYVDTTDDNIADNNEVYTISIDNNGYVEPTSGDKYENVTASGTVTTTIIDNTGEPKDTGTPPEANSEDTIIKLVAVNADGSAKLVDDGNGNITKYTFINDVTEDDAAGYKAVAFNKQTSDVDGYTTVTQLDNQLGSVKVATFATDSDGTTPNATDGTDYVSTIVDASGTAITGETVALNTVFYVDTTDDNIADNNEVYTISIDNNGYVEPTSGDKYENVTASGTVTTTIIDNTGEPKDTGTPPEANSEDTIIKLVAVNADGSAKLVDDGNGNITKYTFINDVTEDDAAGYKAVAFNKQTSDVDGYTTVTQLDNQLGSVKVATFATDSDGTTPNATDGTDYVSTIVDASGTAITGETVALNTVFYVDTTDDNIADNNEVYTVSIDTTDEYVAPTTGDKYENVTASGTVTTTIIDNTGEPKDTGTPPEANSEDTIIKLVAVNADGSAKLVDDGNGNITKYTFINDVTEDDAAGYKAVAFNKQTSDVDGYTTVTQLDNQLGSVVVYTKDLATPEAIGISGTQNAIDGSEDYNTTVVDSSGATIADAKIALNTAFYIDTLDDYLKDSGEKYEVNIDSYVAPTTGDKYENVSYNGKVETTILDGTNDEESNQPIDTLYVRLYSDDEQNEGSNLTHKVQLVDKDGNVIVVKDGENITVTIKYEPLETIDGAEAADYVADTEVTIAGGTSETSFTNKARTDFFNEVTEEYTATITAVAQVNGTYENIMPSLKANGAEEDAITAKGTILDVAVVIDPDNAYVDEDNFDPLEADSTLVGGKHDANGTPLNDSNDTITNDKTLLNLPDVDLNDGEYEFKFENSVTLNTDDIAAGGTDTLTSNGKAITTTVSGNTIIGNDSDGTKIFDIVINKDSDSTETDDYYVYTQYKNIDHPTTTGTEDEKDDTLTMEFGFKIQATTENTDGGYDASDVINFTVTVNDSLPTAGEQSYTFNEDNYVMNNDGSHARDDNNKWYKEASIIVIGEESFEDGKIILNNKIGNSDRTLDNGDSMYIYDVDGNDRIGTVLNNGDGTLTFKSYGNYSGNTLGFDYRGVTDTDGDSEDGTVKIDVTPVADSAKFTNKTADTNEDNAIKINLIAPEIRDSTDKNDINGATAEDHSELLGELRIYNLAKGTEILNGSDDSVLWTRTSSSNLFVLLTNEDGSARTDYHTKDIIDSFEVDSNHIKMTVSEYEALKINPVSQSHTNIKLKVRVAEFEVDDNGEVLSGVEKRISYGKYNINVEAVTDDIHLDFDVSSGTSVAEDGSAKSFTGIRSNSNDNSDDGDNGDITVPDDVADTGDNINDGNKGVSDVFTADEHAFA